MTDPGLGEGLSAILDPQSIAIIGASADPSRVGAKVFEGLTSASYGGRVHFVNPRQTSIHDQPCYPAIGDVPEQVDLAAICAPAAAVPDLIRECGRAGARSAIVFADGFADARLGEALQRALADARVASGLRMIGPNTVGIRNNATGAYLTFSSGSDGRLSAGPVATIAQSGGLSGVFGLAQLRARGLGARYVIDCGNEADADTADFVRHVADDPGVNCISLVVEGSRDGRRLASAVRYATEHGKPVVFLKTGRSQAALGQVASHTGALAGRAELFDAALRDAGACVVRDELELMDAVVLHGFGRVPNSRRLGIVSPSGGYAIVTLDAADQFDMQVPAISIPPTPAQREQVRLGTFANPFDMSSTVSLGPKGLETALLWMASQPEVDSILCWQASILENEAAHPRVRAALKAALSSTHKPIYMCGLMTAAFEIELRDMGILSFQEPTRLVRALSVVAPAAPSPGPAPDATPAATQRKVHAGDEARRLLAGMPDLPHVATVSVDTVEAAEAGRARHNAARIVLKVEAEGIAHKSELGLVSDPVGSDAIPGAFARLDEARRQAGLEDAPIVLQPFERGREMALGAYLDPAFGPAVMVALGGINLEILRDAAFAPAPVTLEQATAMIMRLRGVAILRATRGRAEADIPAAARALVALSQFIAAHAARYAEIDVNPLIVRDHGQGVVAVDAVLVERDPG